MTRSTLCSCYAATVDVEKNDMVVRDVFAGELTNDEIISDNDDVNDYNIVDDNDRNFVAMNKPNIFF